MNKSYTWANNARSKFKVLDASAVGATLEQIEASGPMTPARIVEAASHEESPMHSAFTWDDLEAAEEYRKQEARNLILALEVVISNGEERRTNSFISVACKSPDSHLQSHQQRSYVSVEAVFLDPPTREEVKQEALCALRRWCERYEALGYHEFATVYKFIDRMSK